MIVTRQKNVPWLWVFLVHLPWAGMLFATAVGTIVFTLELRKFTADPAAIAAMGTLSVLVNLFLGPVVNYISDRVWTRWGRRKVFYVPAVFWQAVVCVFIPLAPNIPSLVGLMILFNIAYAIQGPKEMLVQEVVPNHQRGRGSVIHSVFSQAGLFAYNIALIGRFDEVYFRNPLQSLFGTVRGETLMFWVFSAALLSVVLIVAFGVREIKPPVIESLGEASGGGFSLGGFLKKFFVDCFSAEWWPLYLLTLVGVLYGAGIGSMVGLMYTDQWGYSTQQMGMTQAVVSIASVLVISASAAFVDRFDRLYLFGVLMSIVMVLKIFWYCYVTFFVPDQRPSLTEILVFGEGISVFGSIIFVVTYALFYEFIPIDRLGTASAGLNLFRGLLGMVVGPLTGVWIGWYSNHFMPGAGSQVTAVFNEGLSQQEMTALVEKWEKQTGKDFDAKMLVPRGASRVKAQQWELRVKDPEALAIKTAGEAVEKKLQDVQREIDSAKLARRAPAPQLQEKLGALRGELRQDEEKLASKAGEARTFFEGELRERLVGGDAAVRSFAVEGDRITLELNSVYPVVGQTLQEIAKELTVKLRTDGWKDPQVAALTDGKPGIRIAAVAPAEPQMVSLRAKQWLDPLRAKAPGASEQVLMAAAALADSAQGTMAGVRNHLLTPFPDAKYVPQKVDYFSFYLFAIFTELLAILLWGWIVLMERKGKIKRLGALEDPHSKRQPATA